MKRDSAEVNSIQKKYVVASVVHMRKQRPPNIFRKLCGFAGQRGLGEKKERIAGLPLDFYEKLCYNKMGIKNQGARTK